MSSISVVSVAFKNTSLLPIVNCVPATEGQETARRPQAIRGACSLTHEVGPLPLLPADVQRPAIARPPLADGGLYVVGP